MLTTNTILPGPGMQVPFSDGAKVFVEPASGRIGRKYQKARFVEFTNSTFTQRKVGSAMKPGCSRHMHRPGMCTHAHMVLCR